MRRLTLNALSVALVAAATGVFAVGCGQEPAAEEARPASGEADRQPPPKDGGDGRKDGSGQSSSITQRSEGSGGSQSSSIVQRSGSGSVSSSSSQSDSSGGVQTFSGTGSTTLGFNVEKPARLAWTNTRGEPFSAHGDGISIHSSAGRGEVSLAPGRYDDVEVRGSTWTLVVRPR